MTVFERILRVRFEDEPWRIVQEAECRVDGELVSEDEWIDAFRRAQIAHQQ